MFQNITIIKNQGILLSLKIIKKVIVYEELCFTQFSSPTFDLNYEMSHDSVLIMIFLSIIPVYNITLIIQFLIVIVFINITI